MNNTTIFDPDLNTVLLAANNDELTTLVEYLKEKVSELLTTSMAYKKHNPNHEKYTDLIAKEIREMGGNSVTNLFRGEGPSYYEIVCDVADKLKVSYDKEDKDIANIENSIIENILTKAYDKMTDEEKKKLNEELAEGQKYETGGLTTAALIALFRAGKFQSYKLTLIIANAVAKKVLGHGLSFTLNHSLTKTLSVLVGPFGWALSFVWTVLDIAGPAYSVVIPCVIHIAMLRKKYNAGDFEY